MSEAFWQTVLGGALSVLGGFVGTWFIRWRDGVRDARRRRDKLIAAIRVVRYELSSNAAGIASLISNISGMLLPIDVRDRNYREVQFVLARELPQTLREQVARAYETMFVATANLDAMRKRGGASVEEVKAVRRIGDQMSAANEYLTKTLKTEA